MVVMVIPLLDADAADPAGAGDVVVCSGVDVVTKKTQIGKHLDPSNWVRIEVLIGSLTNRSNELEETSTTPSCSGPAPAQKIWGNLVPGRIFHHNAQN